MFTALLVVIIPVALFSPAIFSDVPYSLISKLAFYSSVISIILGILFFASGVLLTEENKKKVVELKFEQGMDAIVLCVPYIIYLSIKQLITK